MDTSQVYPITIDSTDLSALTADSSYDMVGKWMKEKKASLGKYIDEMRKFYPSVPVEILEAAYDFNTDLWQDNEEMKKNNPDGTYKGNTPNQIKNSPDYDSNDWDNRKTLVVPLATIIIGDLDGRYYLECIPHFCKGDEFDISYYDTEAERNSAALDAIADFQNH